MIKKNISYLVLCLLLVGFTFVAFPSVGSAQVIEGCCQRTVDMCADTGQPPVNIPCSAESPFIVGAVCDQASGQCVIARNVPTMSELGLLAMAGILGIAGFMVIRRKSVTT